MHRLWLRLKNKIMDKDYEWRKYNFPLVAIVIIMGMIGTFSLWIIGSGYNQDADFKKHLAGLLLGLIIMAVMSIIDYHTICRFVIIYYIIVIGLVAATRFSPLGTNNGKDAYRWINLPGFHLQPSELCKIAVIFAIAVVLTKLQDKLNTFIPFIAVGAVISLPLVFIIIQPDLSSSIVIVFIAAMMLFSSGLSYKVILPVVCVAVPLFIVAIWYIQQPDPLFIKPYQVERIIGFRHPELYPDIAYQQENSIEAISSGQLYGKYILGGISDVRQYNRVDVTESDFIWSAIGEEFGFIGCFAIIIVLMVFIFICLHVAKNAVDYTGKMLAIGISSMFMFQIFANIGVATMILPNTGLPLPFLSSGLSSVFTYMIAIGVLLNIGIQPVAKAFGRGFLVKNEPVDLKTLKFNDYDNV